MGKFSSFVRIAIFSGATAIFFNVWAAVIFRQSINAPTLPESSALLDTGVKYLLTGIGFTGVLAVCLAALLVIHLKKRTH
ncbi:hypothetical protein C4561_03310 [candidate division WWE3 bacterium]|jgi:uncharacterized membrane protein|uniref:Uncharacterized protein n=1 Tax=candidate division WWE3 bacterium TaxID=2053526 RepID=A0A3A4ZC04_UNCKA|nr:MAG: hypothetical protein C4561_03310 [candidate division WWE3 bacterium]